MISSNLDCCSVHKRNALLNITASVLFAFFSSFIRSFLYTVPFYVFWTSPYLIESFETFHFMVRICRWFVSALRESLSESCLIPTLRKNGNKNLANSYFNAQVFDVIQHYCWMQKLATNPQICGSECVLSFKHLYNDPVSWSITRDGCRHVSLHNNSENRICRIYVT